MTKILPVQLPSNPQLAYYSEALAAAGITGVTPSCFNNSGNLMLTIGGTDFSQIQAARMQWGAAYDAHALYLATTTSGDRNHTITLTNNTNVPLVIVNYSTRYTIVQPGTTVTYSANDYDAESQSGGQLKVYYDIGRSISTMYTYT